MKQEIKERIELINKGIVPAGYKKTPVGICPIEWDASFIGEITKQPSYGLNKSATTNEKYPKYIRITDIDNNGKYLYSTAHVNCSDNNYFLHYGDIVFARTGATCGKNYLYDPRDGDLVFAGFLIKFSADQSKILPSLLFYNCNTNNFWKYVNICSQRSGQPGLNIDDIQKFKINITKNLLEQQKIAEILDCATRQVELQEQLVDKLKVQKKAFMQKLLTPQPDWQEVKLGDICKITTGKLDANEMVENGKYPFFTCSKDIYKIDKYAYDMEALLMAGNGEIGDIKYYNGKFNAYQRTYILYNFTFNIKYAMQYLLLHFNQAVCKGSQKSSMPYIRVDLLNNAKILYPQNLDQIAIFLENFDKKIELQQKLLWQYKLRQKSLMQLLLTGIVRVC